MLLRLASSPLETQPLGQPSLGSAIIQLLCPPLSPQGAPLNNGTSWGADMETYVTWTLLKGQALGAPLRPDGWLPEGWAPAPAPALAFDMPAQASAPAPALAV